MKYISIVLLCILVAVGYGIVHDQITAHLCVEYFTIGHPPVFNTDSPTLLGFGWGILATWWVGLLLGIPMAFAARFGDRPKRSLKSLLRPLGILTCVMAGFAVLAGVMGYFVASAHLVSLKGWTASKVPENSHVLFLTDLWIHLSSYGSGFVGGAILCRHVWRSRTQPGNDAD